MYTTFETSYPPDTLRRFDELLKAGHVDQALLMLYQVGQTPASEVNPLRSLPNWQTRIHASSTIPREVVAVRKYCFDPGRFRGLTTPILFLLGGETLPVYSAATQVLHGSLPRSRVVALPHQQHEGALTAPNVVAHEVRGFFLDG